MKLIGPRIRAARVAKDLKQEYVAEQMGIKQPAYSKIENGQTDITVSQLRQIAAILSISVLNLLEED
jgi:transcriptional regulator with XRE-family HTH domain